jgi:hypothetical protein
MEPVQLAQCFPHDRPAMCYRATLSALNHSKINFEKKKKKLATNLLIGGGVGMCHSTHVEVRRQFAGLKRWLGG